MQLRDWPIKRKLTAMLLLISSLVLLLTTAAFVIYQVLAYRQTTLKGLATLGRIIAANSTASLAFANQADAREILSALRAEPHATAASTRQEYSVRAPKFGKDELGALTDAFNQMLGRIEEQARAVRGYATELELRVAERTHELQERNEELRRNAAELQAANSELDAFSSSVSHDLRAPLRRIDGFSPVLLERHAAQLDEAGRDSLQRVRAASQRMGRLIDDLLKLARVTRAEGRSEVVDLSSMARDIVSELQRSAPERQVDCAIASGLTARGDPRLHRVVPDNLPGNTLKD